MALVKRYKTFSKVQKLILWMSLFFLFYTIFGFLILPIILHKVSVDKLTQHLKRDVTIEQIKFNPYSLLLTINELNIKERASDKTFFAFDQVIVNLQTSSIFRLGPVISELRINDLFLNATRNKDQTYNFSDLIPIEPDNKVNVDEAEGDNPSKTFNFSVSNIVLNNGIIVINDLPKNKTHFFTEMEIGIPFISNLNTHMDIFVTPHFSVNFNGSPINIKGETKPFLASQTTIMNLDLQGIDLKTYFDYIPVKTNLDLKSGKLNLACTLEFSQGKSNDTLPQLFLSGQFNIVKLAVNDLKAKPVFNMDELNISLKKSEILKGIININDCIISSPNISLSFDDSNQLNLLTLLPDNNSDTK